MRRVVLHCGQEAGYQGSDCDEQEYAGCQSRCSPGSAPGSNLDWVWRIGLMMLNVLCLEGKSRKVRDSIDIEFSLHMIEFMLEDSGQEPFEFN